MVQARALAVCDGKVMHVALALHPRRGDSTVRFVLLSIFGQPETDPRVEVDGVLNFGGEHIEVVEPLRVAALVEIVAAQQMRTLLHRCVNFDLKAEGIGELQGAALERLLRKCVRDAVFRKERRGLVEVPLVADLEAEAVTSGTSTRPRRSFRKTASLRICGAAVPGPHPAVRRSL